MTTVLVLLAALLVALLAAAPALAQERRVALVVGNTAYSHASVLPNAVNDADAVATTLRRLGFVVTLVRNQGVVEMRRALRDFSDASRGADMALFFFAGHGLQAAQRDRAENFLVPTDARLADERDLEDETIPLSRVLALMRGARVRVVVLDACRDNPLTTRMMRPGATRSVGRGLAPIDAAQAGGTLVAFSTAPGAVAADGRGPNSPFTEALLRHLPTPGIEIQTMFTRVRAEVVRATNNAQEPWTNSALLEEVFLAGPQPGQIALATQPAPPTPSPAEQELAFWQSIQNSQRVEEFEAYLRRFPQGTFVDLARARIAALRAPAPTAPAPRPEPAVGVWPQGSGYPVPVGQRFRDCPECPELVVIPAGSFMMGSPANEQGRQANEGPQRQVTLHQAIALGGGPVTVGQFRAFVEATGHQTPGGCWRWNPERDEGVTDPALNWRDPGFQQADDHPVVCVSWEDAQAYVRWLSRRTGQGYRLPTEAEWEYAARAGTRTRWWWGARNEDQCRHANGLDQRMVQVAHAWRRVGVAPCNDGFAYTSPVGRFAANRFGLHDMGGNVWQWVEDCYRDSYEGAPEDASQAVKGGDCFSRVLRGGSWYDSYWVLRSAFRLGDKPGNRSGDIGFRVARTPGG